MCDYSLHHVANRPAKIEDKLVATKFHNSITRGFAAVGQPNVAVCLLPGTEIAFDESVECEPSFGIGILPNKKIGQRLARFRQVNMDNRLAHHDALEFPDGQVVLGSELINLLRSQDNPDSIWRDLSFWGSSRAQKSVLAKRRAMELDRTPPADGCTGCRAVGRSPRHQRHRTCAEKRLSLVRLPTRVWSSNNDL